MVALNITTYTAKQHKEAINKILGNQKYSSLSSIEKKKIDKATKLKRERRSQEETPKNVLGYYNQEKVVMRMILEKEPKIQSLLESIQNSDEKDDCTGLSDKNEWFVKIREYQKNHYNSPLVIMYVSIKELETIVERYDSRIADEALKFFVFILVMCSDTDCHDICRLGREEFAVALQTDIEEAKNLKSEILDTLSKKLFMFKDTGSTEISLCVEIGIAEHQEEQSIEKTLDQAVENIEENSNDLKLHDCSLF